MTATRSPSCASARSGRAPSTPTATSGRGSRSPGWRWSRARPRSPPRRWAACSTAGRRPDLFAAELSNAALLGAIKALAFFTPAGSKSLARINYRDMNTEEFGSVYESLLELHPFVEQAPWAFGYVGLNGDATKGTERKLSGSYYTPSSLVQELIKSALEPVIRKTATDHPYDQRAALLGLKIVDPACGSGHFLLAAARRIASEIARIEAAPDAPTEAQRQHALREVVQHCIYGVDKNPLAVELCKTALWIETVEPGKPLSFLDHRIRVRRQPDRRVRPRGARGRHPRRRLQGQDRRRQEGRARPQEAQQGGAQGPAAPSACRSRRSRRSGSSWPRPASARGAWRGRCRRGRAQSRVFERLHGSDGWRRLKDACDLWTAAFFAKLEKPEPGPARSASRPRDAVRKALAGQTPQALTALLLELDDQHFFHWPLEFPEVFDPSRPEAERGFDVVLGNPPWERIKLQEQEFFAERHDGIAKAPNKAARDKLIKALLASDQRRLTATSHDELRGPPSTPPMPPVSSCAARSASRSPPSVTSTPTPSLPRPFLRLISERGRAGIVVADGHRNRRQHEGVFWRSGLRATACQPVTLSRTKSLFSVVCTMPIRFCLLTVAGARSRETARLCFLCQSN